MQTTAKRYIAQCKLCKAVWQLNYDEKQGGNPDVQAAALHTCEGFEKRRAAGWDNGNLGCTCVKVSLVRWKARPDGTTSKCGGRCVHAKGGDCDCQCGGKSHGSGH